MYVLDFSEENLASDICEKASNASRIHIFLNFFNIYNIIYNAVHRQFDPGG